MISYRDQVKLLRWLVHEATANQGIVYSDKEQTKANCTELDVKMFEADETFAHAFLHGTPQEMKQGRDNYERVFALWRREKGRDWVRLIGK